MTPFIDEINILFQSHAGSIEAPKDPEVTCRGKERFQSHAGSIEARIQIRAVNAPRIVSIPRWFD